MPLFDSVRKSFGSLNQKQVDGINALLKASEGLPVKHRAYILATAWHETAFTMQPIVERGIRSYFNKYDIQFKPKKAKELGNLKPGDGFKFRGRGFVMITGFTNYLRASKITGVDLINNPDRACELDIAIKITIDGMTKGWFTGRSMSECSTYKEMRKVINGTDLDDEIAVYAVKFEKALLS